MNNEFNNNLGNQEPNHNPNINEQPNINVGSSNGQLNGNPPFSQSSNSTQSFGQTVSQQVPNNNMNGTYQNTTNSMNGSNPSMPTYSNNSYMNNNGNNKTIIMIIIIAVLIAAVAILGAILVFSKDSGKKTNNKPTNEYEENNNSGNNSNNNSSSNTISTGGFEFTKVSGYEYEEDEGFLTIYNNDYYLTIEAIDDSFADAKAGYRNYATTLEANGYVVGTPSIRTYSGTEIISMTISSDGINAIYYVISSPNSNYIFVGYVRNRNNSPSANTDLKEVISIANQSKYVGNYSNYSKDFKFDFKNIEG